MCISTMNDAPEQQMRCKNVHFVVVNKSFFKHEFPVVHVVEATLWRGLGLGVLPVRRDDQVSASLQKQSPAHPVLTTILQSS